MQCRARNPTPSPVATGANVLSKSKDWVRCAGKRRFCASFASWVIPGAAVGRNPESRATHGLHIWIPGSLASLAPGMTRRRLREKTSLAQVGVFRMLFDIGLGEGAQRIDLQSLAARGIEHAADQRR